MSKFDFPSIPVDQPTLVLGLGETGVAAARWCARHGAPLRVLDTRENPKGLDDFKAALSEHAVSYHLGANALVPANFDGVAQIVVSPGLSPLAEPVCGFLKAAREAGIEVLGEIELFARALADMRGQGYTPKVLAVTGTNGKTTVTAMTRHLLAGCGISARAAGNIGPAALTALADALDTDSLPQAWVLELSSFQLETTCSLALDAAVVLNVTQDHLDWHGSMQAYADAKARLLAMANVAVVNRDDPVVSRMVAALEGAAVRSFGRAAPTLTGDFGLSSDHGVNWLCVAEAVDFDVPSAPRRRKQTEPQRREAGRVSRLMPVDALKVRGVHNALNALAALALAREAGLGWAPLLHALRDYAGEPNRTEFVRTVAGVDFINDSKGTNVGATVAALEGLGQNVVLIAGGLGKGQDFSVLAPVVRAYAAGVVLIGQDAARIKQALADTGVPMAHAATMDDAVKQAMRLAKPGQAVLLSPACASMDMFQDYAHRARVFIDAVNELAMDHGEVV